MSTLALTRAANTPEMDPGLSEDKRTARVTGLWYLALGITGMLGFLIVRPQIFAEGDAAATLANLVDQESLARLGIVAEMGVVVAQTLAAVLQTLPRHQPRGGVGTGHLRGHERGGHHGQRCLAGDRVGSGR